MSKRHRSAVYFLMVSPNARRNRFWLALAAVLALALGRPAVGPLKAQSEHPVTGRPIAPVMSASGADWLERPEREQEEQPEKAIDSLNLKSGMRVGDVGAGTGFYSIRIAKRIGPTGKVYSNDIQPQMLHRLRENAALQKVSNIETVLGSESNPKLPAGELDLVILVDVYHEFSRPQRMLDRIRESLKPDGRLVLLEFRKEDPSVPIRPEHKMSVSEVKAEIIPEGFVFEKTVETLPWQHIIFFRKAVQ